ncbi:MAG: redox-regulated ATPase YchF [Candidatus Magasanikbacteria bacterium RIFCSPHIGHO2_01_FULL_33_34]|uniref:Ribosome-binding ATPase YchF n=1 Tax=Candidatus Magasanikbacteria bacterium RIFCSPHIGHO2_01_FULL_33_34 TaxID=1798671 RepID=A0A1F6LH01_9BACT|nr:MAG: redox-regulated ATPase YchF [Candidatus Magasanikbacteria bacterium RIFCSPHIGHO2_01_FULL_33_34]OGH66189.1 MAG: redox-regulated ATPase YchF [Candidatus Magasanikbacteria bacterium RIFCSPHIGHO2_02_FULL_33_17]OGH76035.1 MAG: redox-regulated ATPase YchF [Candidatus Magasanikbacteria bacterium RIFCSPLOWO2_01_FULL_33_34]OGH82640.1 MAG: redox-regulated ATPase YchF [Candidatus Magasanikbacteria bacterium RIFCSPLOWO2_12_FULL_34_7]
MSLSLGIVGLPNVGKSTLFNALTRSKQADAQNYPFCTIEPNVGIVEVPDNRLQKLSDISKSKKIIPTAIEFVDIAGLVAGASEGEGLGNKFLSHIREVDAIVQVVRAFENNNITHVHNKIDPNNDVDIINLELVLADSQTVKKRLENTSKKAKGIAVKEFAIEIALLEKLDKHLLEGKPARTLEYTDDEFLILQDLHLLTMKPMMYVINDDDNLSASEEKIKFSKNEVSVKVCAKLEAELAELSVEDAKEFMKDLGMNQSGLDKIILAGYKLLKLVTYFTSGEQETRAWTVKEGTIAPKAAAVIHTDFEKGYIKADVTKYENFVEFNGWNGVKENGKMLLVGKDYIVQDGDVCYFHISP